MNRSNLALLTVALGVAGLFTLYALPWVAVSTHNDFADPKDQTAFSDYREVQQRGENSDRQGAAQETKDWGELSTSLGFIFHGFLWGTAISAISIVGYFVRPFSRPAGEAIVLLGCLAIFASIFLILGQVFLLVDVSDLSKTLSAGNAASSAWYGVNYVTPLVAVAFIAVAVWHLIATAPEALRAFGATAHAAPAGAPRPVPAAPLPPQEVSVPIVNRSPPPPPAPRPDVHAPVMERIVEARAHVKRIQEQAKADGNAHWVDWTRQMDTYLDDIEARVKATEDSGALKGIEGELRNQVLVVTYR